MINTNPHGVFDKREKVFSQFSKYKSKDQKEFTCIQFNFNSRESYPLIDIDYKSFFHEIDYWYRFKETEIPNQMFVIHAGENVNYTHEKPSPIVELNIMPDSWLVFNKEEGLFVVKAGAFKHNFKPITVTSIKIEEIINNFSGENLLKLQNEFVKAYGNEAFALSSKASCFAEGFKKACELINKELENLE